MAKDLVNVLSVDWDYFFPDVIPYDWGHSERSLFFIEKSWVFRASNHNIMTGAPALQEVVPDEKLLANFWQRRMQNEPIGFCIGESHKDIFEWLHHLDGLRIWNLDQHHDLGYGEQTKLASKQTLDCGNWALKLLKSRKVKEYHVVYPPWRKAQKEPISPPDKVFVHYDESQVPTKPALIYVCRSGAWTPSWWDNRWLEFIQPLRDLEGKCFRHSHCPYALKARSPNRQEAEDFAKKEQDMLRMLQATEKENK